MAELLAIERTTSLLISEQWHQLSCCAQACSFPCEKNLSAEHCIHGNPLQLCCMQNWEYQTLYCVCVCVCVHVWQIQFYTSAVTKVKFTTCNPSPCHLHLHICSKVYFAFQPSSRSARAVLAYMETMSPLRRSCISKGTTVFVTASKVRSSWRTDTPCPVPRL